MPILFYFLFKFLLFKTIISSSISPTQLVKEMGDLNPLFRGFGQQVFFKDKDFHNLNIPFQKKKKDSQEFLRCLLDRLHEELKIGTKLPTSSTKKSTSSSIISETFEGTLLSKVKCLECNKVNFFLILIFF